VALGIAIDNTLHLLTFFRREVDGGRPAGEALRRAYQHCGNAMLQSTLVCLAGTSVFALADFVPTQRFALLMAALLLLAVIGDLVFLPAILMSPLGRFFHHADDRTAPAAPEALEAAGKQYRFSPPRGPLPAPARETAPPVVTAPVEST
jgi:uncharacterized membrane protein YdfJ with MMPL/SSD domain